MAAGTGDIITTVNRDRWARPMSSLLLLDVYGYVQNILGRRILRVSLIWPNPTEFCKGLLKFVKNLLNYVEIDSIQISEVL